MTDDFIKANIPGVDSEKLMEKVREEIALMRKAGNVEPLQRNYGRRPEARDAIDLAWIKSFIATAELGADITAQIPPMERFPRLLRPLARLMARMVMYLSSFLTDRQRTFNRAAILAMNEQLKGLGTIEAAVDRAEATLRKQIEALASHEESLASHTAELTSHTAELASHTAELTSHKAELTSHTAELTSHTAELTSHTAELASHGAEFDRMEVRYVDMHSGASRMEQSLGFLQVRISQQENHLSSLLDTHRVPSGDAGTGAGRGKERLLDAFYQFFEERFRGERKEIGDRLRIYVPLLRKAGAGTDASPVLDLGSGRGEWLEVLRQEGLKGVGVDVNRPFLDLCRERGLEVVEKDALAYLKGLPTASVGAVTCFHLAEHLPFETLLELAGEVFRVLKIGGVTVFETPNPRNVLVSSASFWLDPTHRRPLPRELMEFILGWSGFSKTTFMELHPFPESFRVRDSDVAERFNEYFYGPQDYAVIGYR